MFPQPPLIPKQHRLVAFMDIDLVNMIGYNPQPKIHDMN